MHTKATLAESFLTQFHDARPGLTSKAFGSLPVVFHGCTFASSYEVLANLVPQSSAGADVLDLACGDGFLLALLAARPQSGVRLSGIDMSAAELAVARDRLGPHITLRQGKAQDLPFASGNFDYVLCHLALMLMDDVERVLQEVNRVLKPGASFAAIVGAAPPPTFAFTTYLEVLARYPRHTEFSELRFGDRRLRHREGILDLLAPTFGNVSIDEIELVRRFSPDELWLWFLDMYDLYLLNEADRSAIQHDYLAIVASHCAPDGKLEYRETLRYISATAG